MTLSDTHKPILKWWKLQKQGEKDHLFILLVASQDHHKQQAYCEHWQLSPGMALGAPWYPTLPLSPCSALTHNTFVFLLILVWRSMSSIPTGWNSADTNLPYRLSILHPSLDNQECGHTGSNSCSCTWIITFSSLRGFLYITSFQEKTKMCSCPVPQSLRNSNYHISINKTIT